MPTSAMRAAIYRGREKVVLETRDLPRPGPGEVRVRMRACGLCGSDLHLFHTEIPIVPAGTTMGHEMTGWVDLLGEGVSRPEAGEAVVIEPLNACGTCPWCRAGRDSICRSVQLYGIHRHGGFADYTIVPARRLFPVPESLKPELAALAEPVAVAVHGLRLGGFLPGQRVLVLGAGSIGLATVGVARDWGAGEILLTARHKHQAELGERLGATRILSEKEASVEALASVGASAAADLVVETVGGNAETLAAAGAAVAPGGTVAVLGVFMEPVAIDPFPLFFKEANLQWSNCYSRTPAQADFEESVRLLQARRDQFSSLLTHSVPLDRIGDAFALAGNKSSGAVKVTVVME